MEKLFKDFLKTLKTNESAISQALGALVVVVVGLLLFNYFKTNKPEPTITPAAEQTVATNQEVELITNDDGQYMPKNLPTTHTVAKGEHLWMISEKYYGNGYNWVDIAKENNLKSADTISEGMTLAIPQATLRYDKEVKEVATNNEVVESGKGASILEATTYTVAKGDHLWSIALRAYGDGYKWSAIYEANKTTIRNPNSIEIGMELTLPR